MRYHKIRTLLPLLGVVLVTGCGGGGSSGDSAAPITNGSNTPTLATPTALVDGTAVGAATWSEGDTATGGSGQTVDGLTCGAPAASYNYAHVTILMNGQQKALPPNIGVVTPTTTTQVGCSYPLRTDDASGKVRFDAAGGSAFTLGQLFDVWGQPLTSTNVAGLAGTSVAAYVNDGGTLTQYTGALTSIPLTAQREITLVIGTPVQQIPTYTWTDPPPLATTAVRLGASNTTAYWPDGDTATGGQGAPVDGIDCVPGMSVNYHVHAHVAIIKDGVQLAVPANIGLPSSGCDYEVHVHDITGQIHMESPMYKRYTVGNLFDIWGEPLSTVNVAGITGEPIVIYINDGGDVRRYTGDPAAIEMISHRVITFQIGTPLTTIPTYTWDSPL